MAKMLVKVASWLSLLPRISMGNIPEIVIISLLVYRPLAWIRNTRTWNLLKGLPVVLAFVLLAATPHLTAILWILENVTTTVMMALLVTPQPKLRKALEQPGSRNYMSCILSLDGDKDNQESNNEAINELVGATSEMAKVKIDALMAVERGPSLKGIERTGTEINGLVTSQLLINIFEHNTPLHDGTAIIRGNRITAATRYLPLTDNMSTSRVLSTYHRAAVSISESMGSITIVVSEETGRVSVTEGEVSSRMPDTESLKKVLSNVKEGIVSLNRLKMWKGRLEDRKKVV